MRTFELKCSPFHHARTGRNGWRYDMNIDGADMYYAEVSEDKLVADQNATIAAMVEIKRRTGTTAKINLT